MQSGQHLLLDGVSKRLLTPPDLVRFLTVCPRQLGLTIISGPYIHKTENGLAGIVVIAESHISIHTDGLGVYLDIFSCRSFDTTPVLDLAYDVLELYRTPKPRVQVLRRGWGASPNTPQSLHD